MRDAAGRLRFAERMVSVVSGSAVSVSDLSKVYRIRSSSQDHPTRATEAIAHRLRNPLRRAEFEDFRALDDISFEIPFGEAVESSGAMEPASRLC